MSSRLLDLRVSRGFADPSIGMYQRRGFVILARDPRRGSLTKAGSVTQRRVANQNEQARDKRRDT